MLPKYLNIRNFASHEDSYVDFTLFDAALIIGMNNDNPDSSNGAGKSSIIEAIDWCLFEKSKYQKVEDVIRYKTDEVRVEFNFDIEVSNYSVIRKRNRAGINELHLKRNGVDISGSTPTDTRKRIEELLRFDHNLFVNSVFLKQNEITYFADVRPGMRKEIVKQILDMIKWDVFEKNSKAKVKAAEERLKEYEDKYNPVDIIEEIRIISRKLLGSRNKLKSDKQRRETLSEKIGPEFTGIRGKKIEYEELSRRRKDLKREQKELLDKKRKLEEECDTIIKMKMPEPVDVRDEDLEELYKEISGLEKEKAALKVMAEGIQKVKDGKCYACGHEVSEAQAKRMNEESKKKFDELKKQHKEVKDKLQKKNKLSAAIENTLNWYNNEMQIFTRGQDKLKYVKTSLEDVEDNIKFGKKALDDVSKDLAGLKEIIDRVTSVTPEEEQEYTDLGEIIEKTSIEVGRLIEKRNGLIREYRAYRADLDIINQLKKEIVLYDQLRWAFGKKGIQSVIMLKTIRELELRSNEILRLICADDKQMAVSIDTQRAGSDKKGTIETFDINCVIGSRLSNFDSLSGGERVRIAFALRVALSQILSFRRGGNIGIILLDEVDSALDKIGVASFVNVINELKRNFKVLVITHKDDIKDMFDHKILVKNDFGVSRVFQDN